MGDDAEERRIGLGQMENDRVIPNLNHRVNVHVVDHGLFFRCQSVQINLSTEGICHQIPQGTKTGQGLKQHPLGAAVAVLEHPRSKVYSTSSGVRIPP